MGYYFKSAKNQLMMMSAREDVNAVLKNTDLSDEQKRKIQLSQKARLYAFEKLKLKETKNYSTYIDLKRPFVTWVVQAAYPWEVKNYVWSYPVVGDMPYKGFFNESDAKEEAEDLKINKKLDVYVRGVAAYSTLGWFQDSLLSSMLRYKDHDLVNTIIHEIVHTTIYIKNNADFNERLAVFIGNKGTELFYSDLEGQDSKTLTLIKNENADDQLFSKFIGIEIEELKTWYQNNAANNDETLRQQRLQKIIDNFNTQLRPHLKTTVYSKFDKEPMNNARLGMYKTYMEDLSHFEIIYKKYNSDLLLFIEKVKTLENSDDPIKDLQLL